MLFFSILLGSDASANARQALQDLLSTASTGQRRSAPVGSSSGTTRVTEGSSAVPSRRLDPAEDLSYLLDEDTMPVRSGAATTRGVPSVELGEFAQGRRGAAASSTRFSLATQRFAPAGAVVDANVRKAVKSGSLSVDKYYDEANTFAEDTINALKRIVSDLIPVAHNIRDKAAQMTKALFQEIFSDEVMDVARIGVSQVSELERDFLFPIREEAASVIDTIARLEDELAQKQEENLDLERQLKGKDLSVLGRLYGDVKKIDRDLEEIENTLASASDDDGETRESLPSLKSSLERAILVLREMQQADSSNTEAMRAQRELVRSLKERYDARLSAGTDDDLRSRKQTLQQQKVTLFRDAKDSSVTRADYELYANYMRTSNDIKSLTEELGKTESRAGKMKAEKELLVSVIKALKANLEASTRVEVRDERGGISSKVQTLSDLMKERVELVKNAQKVMMEHFVILGLGEFSRFFQIDFNVLSDKSQVAGAAKAMIEGKVSVDLPAELKLMYPFLDLLSIRTDRRSSADVRAQLRDLKRMKIQLEQRERSIHDDSSLTSIEKRTLLVQLERQKEENDNKIMREDVFFQMKQSYEKFAEEYNEKETEMTKKLEDVMKALNYNSQALRQIFGGSTFTVPAGFQKIKDLLSENAPLWGEGDKLEFNLKGIFDGDEEGGRGVSSVQAASPSLRRTK